MVRHALTIGFALAVFSFAAAHAQDCSTESSLKSSQPGAAVELAFRNTSSASRRLYWLDPNGERKFIAVVTPGTVLQQPTSAGHSWVVTDDAEKCLHAVTATAEPATIDVGATQVAQVAPPAPGVAQPIAPQVSTPIVAPPVVAQPAPQMQSAPVPAPPQNVAVRLPQVSPVEQFQLNGAYRFVPRGDETKALNSQATGTIEVARVKPEWDSGQWAFEPVAGTPFVRIRNQWKKTVLTDADGRLRATGAPPQASEAHWTFEPVDGTTFVQLRNRETDRFLLAINGAPALVDDFRQDQEIQSHWSVNPAGRAVAAATPRNAAYDSALADCRSLGGYWTGSSCRAVNMAQPLSCRPGWAWAPDAGECVWAGGGRCPPWQMGAGGACLSDIACRGGRVRMSGRGYPVCDCPIGAVTWGNYPNLACVPSVARVAPYLVPAALGAAGVVILGQQGFIGAPGRPTVGQVFGNTKFGGQGGNNNTGVTVNVAATPTTVAPQAPVTTAVPTTPTTVTPPRPVTAAPPTITRDPAPTNRPATPTTVTPQTPVTTAVPATPAKPAPTGIGTAVTTTTPAPANNPAATDTLVKNFAGFDAQTKASVLDSCKKTPAEPSCNAILRSQGALTDAQQASINSCKNNPNLPGCAQVLLGSGLAPRTATTPAVATATTPTPGGTPTAVATPTAGAATPIKTPAAPVIKPPDVAALPRAAPAPAGAVGGPVITDAWNDGIRTRTTIDPKTGVKTIEKPNPEYPYATVTETTDPKTGVKTTVTDDPYGNKSTETIDLKTGVKTNSGTLVTFNPATGVATETTFDPKTGINAIKETNLKTGTETAYKVDTKAAPPPAPPAPPNVTKPAQTPTPTVATATPGTPAPTGAATSEQLSKLDAAQQRLEGGGATPTAVTTPATSPATDTLVKNFNGFDAKTKASVLASCTTTPAEPSCNAILRSQGALTDAQQTSINNCKSNPNLTGCDKLLLGSGLAPRTATTPPVATTPTAGTQTTPATPKAPPTGIGEAWPPTGNKTATTPAAPVLNPAGGAKVATPAAVPAAPAVGTKPAIPAVAPTAVQNNPVTGPNQPPKPTLQKEPESRQATTNPTTPAGTIASPGKPAAATGAAPKPQAPQVQPQRTPPAAKPVQPVQIAKPAPAPAPQAANPRAVPTAKPVPQAAKPVQAVQTARPVPQVVKPAPQVAKPAAAPQAANPAKKCPQGQQRC